MTSTLIIDFLLTDHIDRNRRLRWNVRCENLEPIGPNLKKLSPKNRASRGLKSIVAARAQCLYVSQEKLGRLCSNLVHGQGLPGYELSTCRGWGTSAHAHVHAVFLYPSNGSADCVKIKYAFRNCLGDNRPSLHFPKRMGNSSRPRGEMWDTFSTCMKPCISPRHFKQAATPHPHYLAPDSSEWGHCEAVSHGAKGSGGWPGYCKVKVKSYKIKCQICYFCISEVSIICGMSRKIKWCP